MEMVSSFIYFGSKLSSDGKITADVSCRIAKASKAFACLRVPIFLNRTLSINTMRAFYKALGDFYFAIWSGDMDYEGS